MPFKTDYAKDLNPLYERSNGDLKMEEFIHLLRLHFFNTPVLCHTLVITDQVLQISVPATNIMIHSVETELKGNNEC